MWWRLAEVQTEHQNGEERGFKWLNVEWLLVPDGLAWVFQKLLIYWDFHKQPSLEFTENGLLKISRERQLCGRKCLVDVRGQRRIMVLRFLRLLCIYSFHNINSHKHSLDIKVLFIAAFWNRNNTVTNNTAQHNNTKERKVHLFYRN